jgi:hypothetical protein
VVKAAIEGIKSLRTVEQVARRRGISVPEVYGLKKKEPAEKDAEAAAPQPEASAEEAPAPSSSESQE